MKNLKRASSLYPGGTQEHTPGTAHVMEEQRSQDSCLVYLEFSHKASELSPQALVRDRVDNESINATFPL